MKTKLIGWMLLLLVCGGISMGAGEYRRYNDIKKVSVTSSEAATDSTTFTGTINLGKLYGFNSLHAYITVGNGTPAYAGLGNEDSCILQLYSVFGSLRTILGVDTSASLPATLTVVEHSVIGDTSLYDHLELDYWITDTLADTAIAFKYPFVWDVLIKN